MPPFEPAGGFVLALARAAAVATLLSAFGTLVFGVAVAPRAFAGAPAEVTAPAWRALVRLCRLSLAAACAAALVWLVAEAGRLADAPGLLAALRATPPVLSGTFFGNAVAVRLTGLILVLAVLGRHPSPWRWGAATLLCGGIAGLHSAHSHAVAMQDGPSVLLASQVLHLLAAGAWLGGLLPLLLTVRVTPPRIAAAACRWFSPLGKWCVAAMALTAGWQFFALIGGAVPMIGTAHGQADAAKTLLLVVLLGFAALNRYRLAPALRGGNPATARRALLASIALQTACGLAAVMVASVLSALPPAMHVQPFWPFAWRPSLLPLAEPELLRETGVAAAIALAGTALAASGLLIRRLRLKLIAVGVTMAFWAVPHFSPLLVAAYPTSFYRSPTGFSAQSIAGGAALYPAHCAVCHGARGQGDGPAAKTLAVPPADLTAAHFWDHSDGELFWWLTHGMDDPQGGLSMPGFAGRLTEGERWALIDAMRANNAGLALGTGRTWPRPTPAPRFEADCGDGRSLDLAALNGQTVRIAFAGGAAASASPPDPEPPGVRLATIVIAPEAAAGSAATESAATESTACVAADPAVLTAYALVAGVSPEALAGTQFLVDPEGGLRALWRPGDPPGRIDPAAPAADAAAICRAPLQAPAGGPHNHP